MLEIRALRKSYGDSAALCGIDLDVRAGEIVGLLGPNGAGKTTLMSIVAGLRRPDAGSVQVAGIDVSVDPHAVHGRIGMAQQDVGVYPTLSVRENLVVFGEIHGLRGRELRRRIAEVADPLDLRSLVQRQARTLSGGQQRRLHVAMAMLHRPDLVLLDEPTSGVDVHTRARFHELIRSTAAAGAAVVYSTHLLAEVESLGASVAILESGRVVARGPVDQLTAAHGASVVELTFDGVPPALDRRFEVVRDGTRLRIETRETASTIVTVLHAIGSDAERVTSIEVVRPSLETVYMDLMGRRYQGRERDVTSS